MDSDSGGRVASFVVNGTELLVGSSMSDGEPRNPLDWGMYPMVPYAGRVRNASFVFRGVTHRLPPRAAPHAIHGTVDRAPWRVVSSDGSSVLLERPLGADWPFAGKVSHSISLGDDSAEFVLELTAAESMPAQVGWHPWFVRPATVAGPFSGWMPRDADGMPCQLTQAGLPVPDDGVDDCFTAAGPDVRMVVAGVGLVLASDCSHWVVYTGAGHGVCVEPQSGPPNAIESDPLVLEPGETLRRAFRIGW